MLSPEELIGVAIPSDLKLEEIVTASCSGFRSTLPRLEEFWGPIGLHAGDFDLSIYRATTRQGDFLDRCSAYCATRHAIHYGPAPASWDRESLGRIVWLAAQEPGEGREPELEEQEEPFEWEGTKVGMSLWQLAHFNTLCWDWKRVNQREGFETAVEDASLGAFMRTKDGERFSPRIFAQLAWNYGPEDLSVMAQQVRTDLAKLPEPAHGVPRKSFALLLEEDFVRLSALCHGGGILAHGLMEKPMAEIKKAMVLTYSGNEVRICVETEEEWFGVDFATS